MAGTLYRTIMMRQPFTNSYYFTPPRMGPGEGAVRD